MICDFRLRLPLETQFIASLLSLILSFCLLPYDLRLPKKNYLCSVFMQIEVVKSKIHRVKVTQTELHYVGSITIDEDLMDAATIIENEKVQIVNNNNGERLETHAIPGTRGSGEITLNGAAARKVTKGDVLILITYAIMEFEEAKNFRPALVFPDEETNLLK